MQLCWDNRIAEHCVLANQGLSCHETEMLNAVCEGQHMQLVVLLVLFTLFYGYKTVDQAMYNFTFF